MLRFEATMKTVVAGVAVAVAIAGQLMEKRGDFGGDFVRSSLYRILKGRPDELAAG